MLVCCGLFCTVFKYNFYWCYTINSLTDKYLSNGEKLRLPSSNNVGDKFNELIE